MEPGRTSVGYYSLHSTRIDKNPGPGDYVRIRGRISEDGKITAERVTRR